MIPGGREERQPGCVGTSGARGQYEETTENSHGGPHPVRLFNPGFRFGLLDRTCHAPDRLFAEGSTAARGFGRPKGLNQPDSSTGFLSLQNSARSARQLQLTPRLAW
jgi:hypothetical protein